MEESDGELDTGIRDAGVAGSVLADRAGVDLGRLAAREAALDATPIPTPGPTPTDAAEQAAVLPEPDVEPVATAIPGVVEPLTGAEAAICAYSWDCTTALRIVRCESNFRPDAVGAGSYGLFQIQASVHAWKWPSFWDDWMIPERNLEYAWAIYQGRGWYAWSCF